MACVSRHPYDPSDLQLDVPVSVDECETLRNHLRPFGKDTTALDHFLVRVERTLMGHAHRMKAAQRDIEALQQAPATGRSTSLDPVDAIRYVPPDQLKAAVGALARHQLGIYDQLRHQALAERASLSAAAQTARDALAGLADAPMSDEVRQQLAAAWEALTLPPDSTLPDPKDYDPDAVAPAMAHLERGTA